MPDRHNSNEPLIEKEEGEEEAEWHSSNPKRIPRSRQWILFAILQVITICLIPTAYFLGRHSEAKLNPKLPTHPASQKGDKRILRKLDDEFFVTDPKNKKFKGLPRPELDDAWDSLYEHMNIRVSPSEAQKSNWSSVELSDGSGDLYGMPTVFHSIHCLKTIRQVQFPESYPESWEMYKPPFKGGINDHLDHCIDNIRQAIMCQGDLSLYHYKWVPKRAKPMPLASQEHVCIDWDNMMEWAAARSFDLNDRLLKAPDADTPWDPNT